MVEHVRDRDRLRQHPEERFAGSEDQFDLNDTAARLAQEPSGQHGHKQIALFKHGPATVALYLLEPMARLANHIVDGPVILHVLRGAVRVHSGGRQHLVQEGQLLRLSPGVPHDIEAEKPTELLMTTMVEGPGSRSLE